MKQHLDWCFPDADEFMANEMKPDGSYQASHLAIAMGYVVGRRVAVDGGAHVGTWTRLMSALFESVIAVEPADDTFEALTANILHFELPNVTAKHAALGAVPGLVSMTLDGPQRALKNTGGRYVCSGGTIPVETIDSWDLDALDFLKLDVEGSEVDALVGAKETITRCRPIILYENKGFWRRYGHGKHAPQQVLERYGYRLLAPAGRDVVWGPM